MTEHSHTSYTDPKPWEICTLCKQVKPDVELEPLTNEQLFEDYFKQSLSSTTITINPDGDNE